MHILAIDVGTSSVKAAVLDVASAAPIGSIANVEYELDHPIPEAAEVSTERLWNAVVTATNPVMRQATVAIDGIGLSCLTPGLVLLDERDKPLSAIWTHLDRRARPAARQIWAAVGDEFLATTGNRPLPGGISVVVWRQQLDQDPYLFRKVRSYLHVNGWLAFHMTGEKAFDPANACFSGLFNSTTDQQWSDRWCAYFEMEKDWLPPVVDGRSTLGRIRPRPAAQLGVPAGLPVKLGTADTSCAMLAAEMKPGDLLHVVGTTQVLAALVERPLPSPRRLTRRLGVGASFVHVTHNPVGGAAFEWLRDLCFRDQNESVFFNQTIPAALQRETRVSLDPPFLGGDRLEIEAHRASFRDLTLSADRMDLLAALLTAMRLRHRESVTALGVGENSRRVFLTGGGAEVVRQLLPEYAEDRVQSLDEGSLRGVAKLFTTPI